MAIPYLRGGSASESPLNKGDISSLLNRPSADYVMLSFFLVAGRESIQVLKAKTTTTFTDAIANLALLYQRPA